MNRYKQAPTLVKVRTILVIILSALVASVIIELVLAERTNALLRETVQGTTSLVQQVLSPVAPSAPAQNQNVAPPAPVQSPAAEQTNSPSQPVAPASGNSSVNNPVVPAPVIGSPPVSTNLQKIYFSKTGMSSESLTAAKFTGAGDNVDPLTTFSWLQATDRGWKVAEVMWYWWLAGASIVALSLLVWRQRINQYVKKKLLYTQHILYAE